MADNPEQIQNPEPTSQASSEGIKPESQNAASAGAPAAAVAEANPAEAGRLQFADSELEKEIRAKAEKLGVKVEELLMLPMTHENILHLLDLCPYLQIVNSESNSNMTPLPKLIEAQSGWIIYDYGDAMCASPGDLLFSDNLPDPPFLYGLGTKAGGAEDDESGTGRGTILKQSVDTAAEMIFLAIQRAWGGATIVEGHPRMKWAAWIMAGDHEYNLSGYEPSAEDVERRKRLRRSRSEIDEICLRVKKGMGK